MMAYAGEYEARDGAIETRRRRLSENFVSQALRDPRTVFDAIWTRLTYDAGHNDERVLVQLEDAIAQAARVPGLQQPVFRLELRHTCKASGCGNAHCSLCKDNPSRACIPQISPRNLVDTELKSQCGARVEVHVVPLHPEQGHPLPPFRLQVCVLEKNHCNEAAWHNLAGVALLSFRKPNQEVHRLLCVSTKSADAPMGHMHPDFFVYFPTADTKSLGSNSTAGNVNTLPDLILKASGESVVKSKLPDLALAIRAVDLNLQPLDNLIQPVFSNFFQVATKRTKGNMKVDIPFITTEVSKIEGIGAETRTKLSELDRHMGPGYFKINTVGDLRDLVNSVQQNDAEKSKLLKALKMNKESWETVVAHVHKAVEIDNRMRVFTRCVSTRPRRDVGLVFTCKRGALQATQDGLQGYVERINGQERFVCWRNLQQHKYDVHSYCLASLLEEAQLAWAETNHPGWDFFRPRGSEVDSEEGLPCDGSSVNGVRYRLPPGWPEEGVPAYGSDGHSLPLYAPLPLDNDGDLDMAAPSGDYTLTLTAIANSAPGSAGPSATGNNEQVGARDFLPPGMANGSMPPPMDLPPPMEIPFGSSLHDMSFHSEFGLSGMSIWEGTQTPLEGFESVFGGASNRAVGQAGEAQQAARGITRTNRSFVYNQSGSFRMPDNKRLNHLTSSDLQNAEQLCGRLVGGALDEPPSWEKSAGEQDAGPAHHDDLMGASGHPSSSQPPGCFQTGDDHVDELDVRDKLELQQVSYDYCRTVLQEPDSIGGSNPFFDNLDGFRS